MSTLASVALAVLESFECETLGMEFVLFSHICDLSMSLHFLGDPQTAVTHLGHVVLFAQSILARYNVSDIFIV